MSDNTIACTPSAILSVVQQVMATTDSENIQQQPDRWVVYSDDTPESAISIEFVMLERNPDYTHISVCVVGRFNGINQPSAHTSIIVKHKARV
jgi:hypothetical protein